MGAIYIAGRAPVISVGGLTTYAKGAPILQDVAVAPVAHVGYAGSAGWPYGPYIGKREADSDAYLGYGYGLGYGIQHVPAVTSVGGLTTYSNGAVGPTDVNNGAATSAHLAGKGLHGVHLLGKREAEPYYGIYGAYPVT